MISEGAEVNWLKIRNEIWQRSLPPVQRTKLNEYKTYSGSNYLLES